MKNVCSVVGKAFLLLGFCIFFSCRSKDDNSAILKEIDEGLVQSNRQIRLQTDDILQSFEQKLADPKTAYKTAAIQPKALSIHAQTDSLIAYIDSLKSLITDNVSSKQNSKQEKTIGNDEAVRKVFADQNGAAQLYAKLQQYKQVVIKTDERIKAEIPELIVLVNKRTDSTNASQTFLKKLLEHSSAIEALTYLNRIENNIAISETRTIAFLNAQIASYSDGYESFETIVGQNAQRLEVGQTLEITAGVGRFTVRNLIGVIINNQKQVITERGVAIYKIKTLKKPGTYRIPVQIIYTDQDGQEQKITIPINYKTVSANLK